MVRGLRAEIRVGAALFHDGRMLLLRRASTQRVLPGKWVIPGGHVEEGEGLLTALLREVKEETGFMAGVERPFYADLLNYPRDDGRSTLTVELDFLCSVASPGPPHLDPVEHSEYAWIRRYVPSRHPASRLLQSVIRAALTSR